MKKYVKNIVDNKCNEVFTGTDIEWAISQGFIEFDVEEWFDGSWYIKGYAPEKPQSEINQERIDELQAYLTSTDWYAVRYAETGVAIPDDVVTARSSAREEISTLRVDVEDLI